MPVWVILLKNLYWKFFTCCNQNLVVTKNEGYHVFEFLFQGLGPQNIQICLLSLLSEKEDRVVFRDFNQIQ